MHCSALEKREYFEAPVGAYSTRFTALGSDAIDLLGNLRKEYVGLTIQQEDFGI